MPQSLSKVIIHIIFSTKNRDAWLDREVRPRLQAYVATICRDLHADAFCVGGVADHLHIVTTLPRTLAQAEMVETVEEDFIEMDQTAGSEISRFPLATRLWRVLS